MIAALARRIAFALLLLVGLSLVAILLPEQFPLLVATLLLGVLFVQWAAVLFFNAKSVEDPSIVSLRARAQDSVSLAFAGTVGAILGLLVVLRALGVVPFVDRLVFLVGIAFALLMTAAPAVNWLLIWRPWRGDA